MNGASPMKLYQGNAAGIKKKQNEYNQTIFTTKRS